MERAEPGCLAIGAFRSTRNPRRVAPLIDHPLDVTRAGPIG